MNEEIYQNLANAIVQQAAKDYIKALKQKKKYPNNPEANSQIRELKRFFHSGWYGMLTKVDGDYLIRALEQKVAL